MLFRGMVFFISIVEGYKLYFIFCNWLIYFIYYVFLLLGYRFIYVYVKFCFFFLIWNFFLWKGFEVERYKY